MTITFENILSDIEYKSRPSVILSGVLEDLKNPPQINWNLELRKLIDNSNQLRRISTPGFFNINTAKMASHLEMYHKKEIEPLKNPPQINSNQLRWISTPGFFNIDTAKMVSHLEMYHKKEIEPLVFEEFAHDMLTVHYGNNLFLGRWQPIRHTSMGFFKKSLLIKFHSEAPNTWEPITGFGIDSNINVGLVIWEGCNSTYIELLDLVNKKSFGIDVYPVTIFNFYQILYQHDLLTKIIK